VIVGYEITCSSEKKCPRPEAERDRINAVLLPDVTAVTSIYLGMSWFKMAALI